MAILQRWRRRSSAGEGAGPGTDVGTDGTGPVTVGDDPGDHAEPAPGGDAQAATVVEVETVGDEPAAPEDVVDTARGDEEVVEENVEDEAAGAVPAGSEPTPATAGTTARRPNAVVQLVRAAHAKQAIATALAMGAFAAITGRPAREAGVVLVTVLVGQTILGWHNDIVDASRDRRQNASGKPIAEGKLETDVAWYAIVVAALALVPLSVSTGITAACFYLASVAVGMLGNILFRTGLLSWWSWAASFALLPYYLSYGGWGGQAVGDPPETPIVLLAGALGIGVHFTRAVWGLVADHAEGWTYLPLKLGLRMGATRLLALATFYNVVVVVLLIVVGAQVGLSR